MNFRIIMEKDNVAMVASENNHMYAYVNGKYYDVHDKRPAFGADGRQLREDTRDLVDSMYLEARNRLKELNEKEAAELEAYAKKYAEQHAAQPVKTFAEALQDSFLNTLTQTAADDLLAMVFPKVEQAIVEKFGAVPKPIRIEVADRPAYETTEVLHKDFERILSMLLDNESVYLCGPAGTGKSYIAQQLATAMSLEYYYTNSVTDDVQLKGFIDANGRYHDTQFYKAFTQGGVFLLDELDGSIPETLVLLNNALANGYFDFPVGRTTAHKDFHCIAAGNTFGTGADNVYTGRYALDQASMDRFALIIVDYDSTIETNIASGDTELVDFAHAYRTATNHTGITSLFTYRSIKRLNKFKSYMSKADSIRIGLTKGLAKDDLQLIVNNIKLSNNSWFEALKQLVGADSLPF